MKFVNTSKTKALGHGYAKTYHYEKSKFSTRHNFAYASKYSVYHNSTFISHRCIYADEVKYK